jgi:hypothetical protein
MNKAHLDVFQRRAVANVHPLDVWCMLVLGRLSSKSATRELKSTFSYLKLLRLVTSISAPLLSLVVNTHFRTLPILHLLDIDVCELTATP